MQLMKNFLCVDMCKAYLKLFFFIIIIITGFEKTQAQCDEPTITRKDYCVNQPAYIEIDDNNLSVKYAWYSDMADDVPTYGTDGSGRNFESPNIQLNSGSFYYEKEVVSQAGPVYTPPSGGSDVDYDGTVPYAMPLESDVDFRVNSVTVVVRMESDALNYGLAIRALNGAVETYSDWLEGSRSEYTSLGSDLYKVEIPVDIVVNAGANISLELVSDDNGHDPVEGMYFWGGGAFNGASYANGAIRLADSETDVSGSTLTPMIMNWDITIQCSRTEVVTELAQVCCIDVGENFSITTSGTTFPITLTASGADIDATMWYYWYDADNTLLTSGQGVNSYTVADKGQYSVRVVNDQGNEDKFACYGKKSIVLGIKSIEAPEDFSICLGDYVSVRGEGAEGDYNWYSDDADADSYIATKNVQETELYIQKPGEYTYVVEGEVKLGNVANDGKFEKFTDDASKVFESSYGFVESISGPGEYKVDDEIYAWSTFHCNDPSYWQKTDPVTGDVVSRGNIFIADAVANQTGTPFTKEFASAFPMWRLTGVTIEENTCYTFSADVSNWNTGNPSPNIMLLINDEPVELTPVNGVGTTLTGPNGDPYYDFPDDVFCEWETVEAQWCSGPGETSATIAVSEVTNVMSGYEFAMDDITFFTGRGMQSDEVNITVEDCNEIEARPDGTSCVGDEFELYMVKNNGFFLNWTNSAGEVVSTEETATGYPLSNETFTAHVKFPLINFLENGDFESDNRPTFDNDLALLDIMNTKYMGSGYYYIGDNTIPLENTNINLAGLDDHTPTPGANNMMFAVLGDGMTLLKKTIPAKAGEEYVLSFWLNHLHTLQNCKDLTFQVLVGGSVAKTVNISCGSDWTEFTHIWEAATSGDLDVEIRAYAKNSEEVTIAIDDITLAQLGKEATDNVVVSAQICNTLVLSDDCSPTQVREVYQETDGIFMGWFDDTDALISTEDTLRLPGIDEDQTITAKVGVATGIINENGSFEQNDYEYTLETTYNQYNFDGGNHFFANNSSEIPSSSGPYVPLTGLEGSGKFLAINPATGTEVSLIKTVPIALEGETTYSFKFSVAYLKNTAYLLDVPELYPVRVVVDGVEVASFNLEVDNSWQTFNCSWLNKASSNSVIELIVGKHSDYNLASKLSYAIDAMSLQAVHEILSEERTVEPCTPPCELAGYEGIDVLNAQITTSDTVLCPGSVATLKANMQSSGWDADKIAWAYFESSIADTATASPILDGEANSAGTNFGIDNLPNVASGTYTLAMWDKTDASNKKCRVAYEVTIDEVPLPTYYFSDDQTICDGDDVEDVFVTLRGESSFTFTVEDKNTGTVYATTPSTIPGNDSVFSIAIPTSAGVYDFVVTSIEDAYCTGIPTDDSTMKLTISATPSILVSEPDPICEYDGIIDLSALITEDNPGAGVIKDSGIFTSDNADATAAIDNASYEFDPSISGVGNFEVTYTYTSTMGCSTAVDITVAINEKPDVSFTIPDRICTSEEPIVLEGVHPPVSNTGPLSPEKWELIDGTVVSEITDGVFNPEGRTNGSEYTIRYIFRSDEGCIDSAENDITVYHIDPPTVNNSPSTNYQTVDQLEPMSVTGQTGATFNWYFMETGDPRNGTPQGTNGSIYTAEDTTNLPSPFVDDKILEYYVTQTNNGCTSDSAVVQSTISACLTGAPEVVPGETCFNAPSDHALYATGKGNGNIYWINKSTSPPAEEFVVMSNKSEVEITANISPLDNKPGIITYEVYQFDDDNNCRTASSNVTFTVLPLPEPKTGFTETAFCSYGKAVSLDAKPDGTSGTGVYSITNVETNASVAGAITMLGDNAEFDPALVGTDNFNVDLDVAYTFTDEKGCVNTDISTIQVTFADTVGTIGDRQLTTWYPNELTVEATGIDDEGEVTWFDEFDSEIAKAGHNASWNPTIPTETIDGDVYYKEGTYSYYVNQEVRGCISDKTVAQVMIIDCPSKAPAVTHEAFCYGETAKPFVSANAESGAANNNNLGWFTLSDGVGIGNEIGGGRTSKLEDTVTVPGTYTYLVSEWNEDEQCYGMPAEATITIYALPDVAISIEDTLCYASGETEPIVLTPTYEAGKSVINSNVPWIVGNTSFRFDQGIDNGEQTGEFEITYEYTKTNTDDSKNTLAECTNSASKMVTLLYIPAPTPPDDPIFLLQDEDETLPADPLFVDDVDPQACVNWYNNGLSPLLGANDCGVRTYQSPDKAEGMYTYYASQVVHGCESDKVPVYLEISKCPVGGLAIDDQVICLGDVPAEFIATPDPAKPWVSGFAPDGDEEIHWFNNINRTGGNLDPESDDHFSVPAADYAKETAVPREYYAFILDPDLACYGKTSPFSLTVHKTPVPSIIPPADICEGVTPDETKYKLRALGSQIQWYNDTAISNSANRIGMGDLFVTETAPGSYSFWATATEDIADNVSCESDVSDEVVYTIIASPNTPSVTDKSDCGNSADVPTLSTTSTDIIKWFDASDNFLQEGNTLTLSFNNMEVGDNTFKAIAYSNTTPQCPSDATEAVFTKKLVPPVPVLEDINAICKGESDYVTIEALSPTDYDIYWIVDIDMIAAPSQSVTIDLTNRSAGNVSVAAQSEYNGCTSAFTISKLPIKSVPVVDLIVDSHIFCSPSSKQYKIKAIDLDSTVNKDPVSFEFIDLLYGIHLLKRTVDPSMVFVEPDQIGMDVITVVATNGSCSDTIRDSIYGVPAPDAYFDHYVDNENGTATIVNGTDQEALDELWMPEINYTVEWGNIDSIYDAGDFSEKLSHNFEWGYYTVALHAVDEFGCSDTYIDTIFIDITKGLFVPNALAPGTPGQPAYFLPMGHNLKKYKLSIYDSWGNLVFFTDKIGGKKSSPVEPWHGTDSKGNVLMAGYYIWKIEAVFKDGKEWQGVKNKHGKYKTFGNVLLIR